MITTSLCAVIARIGRGGGNERSCVALDVLALVAGDDVGSRYGAVALVYAVAERKRSELEFV